MFRVYVCFCPHPNIKRHLLFVFRVSEVTMHNIIIFIESYKVDHFLEVSLTPGKSSQLLETHLVFENTFTL